VRSGKKRLKKVIVAVDGPAGSGKSTVAKGVARRLGLPYLDTGAMYRALTFLAIRKKVPLADPKKLARLARQCRIEFRSGQGGTSRVLIDGLDVTRQIRRPRLTQKVRHVASVPAVRAQMVKLQRRIGKQSGGVVEGRDITTVVFPKAPHKFYIDADFRTRVRRRYEELRRKGMNSTLEEVARDQKDRDESDFKRKVGPLRKAKDATYLDTTALTIDQVVDKISESILSGKP